MKSKHFIDVDIATELERLVDDKQFITEPTVSKQLTSLEDLDIFQMRTYGETTYCCIPSNFLDLVQKNYLVKLFAKSLKYRKVNLIVSDKAFESKLELTDVEGKLHGLGTVLLGKVKPYNKQLKGPFKAGIYCGLKSALQFKGKVDIRIFKFHDALTPSELILTSAWGNKYPIEKMMLDSVIYCIHRTALNYVTLFSYLVTIPEIEKLYGIVRKLHVNKVIDNTEQSFIVEDHKGILEQETSIFFKDYDELIIAQESLSKFAKKFRKYKDTCTSIIDTRMRVIYSGKKSKKQKSVSITTLIEQKKGTLDYMNAFSPCMAAGLGVSFRVGSLPSKQEEYTVILKELDSFVKKFEGKVDKTRIDIVFNWFSSELQR